MNVKSCVKCKKIFNHISGLTICPQCKAKEEEIFQEVKMFLRKYPGASAIEIHNALNIPMELIKRFIQEGLIEVISTEGLNLKCKKCNKSIVKGEYCVTCSTVLLNELNQAKSSILMEKETEKSFKGKMYTSTSSHKKGV